MQETQTLIENIGAYSYVGVFVISFLANVVVPVPEEIVILAIGYVIGTGQINMFLALPIVMAGLLISDTIMYFLAKRGARILTLFYERVFAKILRSKRAWIDNHPGRVVFWSRFMVQLRFLGPFIAGQQKMPYTKFLVYELSALIIYVPILLILGSYFQDRLESIISGVGIVRNIILIVLGIGLLITLSKFVRDILLGQYMVTRTNKNGERTHLPRIRRKETKTTTE